MAIKILKKNTAEQIAAGEVIENPSSVVKELVENALDAGADKIDVELVNGGKSLISVTDNGHGITAAELPLAFERFATSKLTVLDDLYTLTSLGFRGEALPSIAAVAKVKMTTRSPEADSGASIVIEGGEIVEQSETGAPPGTRVEVSSLFFNTPGRQKFLRADAVESAKVSALLSEISLANPGTAFTLRSGKRSIFHSNGDGNLLHAIGSIYGSEAAGAMLEINHADSESGCSLQGYTSAPYLTRSSRRWITLVVNGRLIKNQMMVNALERAYSDYLPSQRHPLAVLFLTLPQNNIDINVHPAKIEVRFKEPETIKTLIYRAVKMGLQVDKKLPRWPEEKLQVEFAYENRIYNKYDPGNSESLEQPAKYETDEIQTFEPEGFKEAGAGKKTEGCRLIGQFLQSYLVVQKGDNLLLIDQHAAHERINYHLLQHSTRAIKERESVQLTIPLTVNLPVTWRNEMPGLLPLLRKEGFDLELIGEDSYVIRSVPYMLSRNAESIQFYDLLEQLITGGYNSEEEYRDAILKSIACHRSVKAKQALTRDEMEQLLQDWEKTPRAEYCPHGRPTVISFGRPQLEKGFQRKGSKHEL